MTFPSIVLGTIIAVIIGCGFHFWRGGGFKWMITYILFSVIGFWVGQLLAGYLEWNFIKLGPINLGTAIICSVISVISGYWLSMASTEINKKK